MRAAIARQAATLGFDAVGFAPARLEPVVQANLAGFLCAGYHGTMQWLAESAERRRAPERLWPGVRSVIALGHTYAPAQDPLTQTRSRSGRGAISVYAQNRDYHDVIKKRLKALGRWLVRTYACDVKVFVDTAPVMEKPLAQRAGLGWQGKHTNLVSRRHGSWLFLGEVFTSLVLAASDDTETDHCGRCQRCLQSCPTQAFPAPYRIDARRCVSYLTIEHKGPIPRSLRPGIGNRIYGCDDCLAVCPWNKFATPTHHDGFHPRRDVVDCSLRDFLTLDDSGFRMFFSGSPIKRIGRDRFLRNVLYALGNVGTPDDAPAIEQRLCDPSPLVRGAAVWALQRLLSAHRFQTLRTRYGPNETESSVRQEWWPDQAPPGLTV